MAITPRAPNTIHLSGPIHLVVDVPAGEAITPGHLIEMYLDGSTTKWRKNASATEIAAHAVALEQIEFNKTIDDDYVAGDLVRAGFLGVGAVFYPLIASGQDIVKCELLQSAGDGTMKAATATTADAGLGEFQALDGPGAVTALTRLRVQVIK
jgi:hypothetical protein